MALPDLGTHLQGHQVMHGSCSSPHRLPSALSFPSLSLPINILLTLSLTLPLHPDYCYLKESIWIPFPLFPRHASQTAQLPSPWSTGELALPILQSWSMLSSFSVLVISRFTWGTLKNIIAWAPSQKSLTYAGVGFRHQYFFKSPGDANTHPDLRTTAVAKSSLHCSWWSGRQFGASIMATLSHKGSQESLQRTIVKQNMP